MQNEACIKQGSEKESFRQQLIEARARITHLSSAPEFDDAESDAIAVILHAADEQRMSPKAFLQAARAIQELQDLKESVLQIGYSVEELTEREDAKQLYQAVRDYSTKRAEVLGFKKALTPSGWDILED